MFTRSDRKNSLDAHTGCPVRFRCNTDRRNNHPQRIQMINAPRVWMDRELAAFGASLPAGAFVLDAGAGSQRYKTKFAHCAYESTDFEQVNKLYKASTYVCDLRSLPIADARFDAVVFTQVMEHLPDPLTVVRELSRVLKPSGKLFYSGPFWYEEHEQPYDFYRYTQFAIRHIFENADFQITELRWLDGYMASVAHQLRRMQRALPRTPAGYGRMPFNLLPFIAFNLFRLPCALLASLAARCDVSKRFTDRGYPMNYMAILQKNVS